jgi:hypothetical protein
MSNTLLADRRDHVIEQLTAGYAGDAFDVDELERRLALAHTAQTPAELDGLVTDLVPTSATTALVPAKRLSAVLGSIERVGPWTVPPHLAARALWGNIVLDLRDAQLGPGVTTIEVKCTMGNIEILVPPAFAVDVDVSSFMGNVEERTRWVPKGAALVRIVGRVRLGNVEVTTVERGETKRDARRRERWERRAARHRRRLHERAFPRDWR